MAGGSHLSPGNVPNGWDQKKGVIIQPAFCPAHGQLSKELLNQVLPPLK